MTITHFSKLSYTSIIGEFFTIMVNFCGCELTILSPQRGQIACIYVSNRTGSSIGNLLHAKSPHSQINVNQLSPFLDFSFLTPSVVQLGPFEFLKMLCTMLHHVLPQESPIDTNLTTADLFYNLSVFCIFSFSSS